MALLSGLIGGLINAAQAQVLELTPQVKRQFLLGFVICRLLSLPATYYSNVAFSYILSCRRMAARPAGSLGYLILARLVGWTLMGLMLGPGLDLRPCRPPTSQRAQSGDWSAAFWAESPSTLISMLIGRRAFLAAVRTEHDWTGDRTVYRTGAGTHQGRLAEGRGGPVARTRVQAGEAGRNHRTGGGKPRSDCSETPQLRHAMR